MKGLMTIPQEEKIQSGTYSDNIPDGNYTVIGVESFITKDDAGKPCFAPSKNPIRKGVLEISFKLKLVDGSEGPAVSCTPAEFWMLVDALGGDSKIPAKQRTSSDTIERAVSSMNESRMSLTVQSKKGWVNSLYKLIKPPKARYTVVLAEVHRQDRATENPLHFQSSINKFGGGEQFQLMFEFEIVGNAQGKPTVYDGHKLVVYMSNPFTESYTGLNEHVYTIYDEDITRPLWAHTEKGGIVPSVLVWEVFANFFCTGIENHEWIKDAEVSAYGVNELQQPQYVLVDYAMKAQERVVVYWKEKERSKTGAMAIAWDEIPVDNSKDIDVEEEEEQPAQLNDLINYIEKKNWGEEWVGVAIFDQSDPDSTAVVFTDQGKKWAEAFMLTPWTKAGLKDRKALHALDTAEVERLYKAFISTHGLLNQESGW